MAANQEAFHAYLVNVPIYFKQNCVRKAKTKIPIQSIADKTNWESDTAAEKYDVAHFARLLNYVLLRAAHSDLLIHLEPFVALLSITNLLHYFGK